MTCRTAILNFALAAFIIAVVYARANAQDLFILKSGRLMHGDVVTETVAEDSGRPNTVIKMESGSLYELDRKRLIARTFPDGELDQEYRDRFAEMPDTAEANWNLQLWCSSVDGGKFRFAEQIRFHLQNVIELDPDHRLARSKLGYDQLDDGTWVLAERFAINRGYQRQGTGWAPMMQDEVVESRENADAILGRRKSDYVQWQRDVRKNKTSDIELARRLAEICDEHAIGLLAEDAFTEPSVRLREMYIDAFATVNTNAAIDQLVLFAIADPDQALRERAMAILSQPEYDHTYVVLRMTGNLKSNNNAKVNQAAAAIAEVSSTDDYSRQHILMPLANALVTRHTFSTDALEAGRMAVNTNTDGSLGGFSTGGGPQTVDRDLMNEQVYSALKRLSEVDFRFDTQAWKDWFIETHTMYNINVRGDE